MSPDLRNAHLPCALLALLSCGDSTSSTSSTGAGAASTTQGSAGGFGASGGWGGCYTTTDAHCGGGGSASSGGAAGGGGASSTPLFVAVGYGGRRMISTDGVAWTDDVVVDPMGGDDNNLFRGVGYGNGTFVAVGGSSEGQIFTSADGVTWTPRTPGSSWIGDVAFDGGVFIAAGGNGLRQRSEDLGATWIDQGPYYAGHFRGIASGDGLVVAAGHTYGQANNEGLIARSIDLGATWETELVGGPQYGSIAFGAGRFVAAGQAGCRSSADGVEWAACGVAGELGRVVFLNDQFLIPDATGLFVSTDGVTWSHIEGPSRGLTSFGQGIYLAIGWPDRIERSTDLASYTVVNQDTGPAFTEIVFGTIGP